MALQIIDIYTVLFEKLYLFLSFIYLKEPRSQEILDVNYPSWAKVFVQNKV